MATRSPNYEVNNNLPFKEPQHIIAIDFASHDTFTIVYEILKI